MKNSTSNPGSLSFWIVLVLFCLLSRPVWADTWKDHRSAGFAGGTGTVNDPYIIATAAQLGFLSYMQNDGGKHEAYIGKYFSLTADIDLNGYEWDPIGYDGRRFGGKFNGNNHVIRNMKINQENSNDRAFFGSTLKEFRCDNLSLESVDVLGRGYCGGLVGFLRGSIENCHVLSGTIRGYFIMGGLVGEVGDNDGASSILRCSAGVAVNQRLGSGSTDGHCCDAGGIVGVCSDHTTIRDVLYYGSMALNYGETIGGIIGYVGTHIVLSHSVYMGTTSGSMTNNPFGSLVGCIGNWAPIYNPNCYSTNATAVGWGNGHLMEKVNTKSATEMNKPDFAYTLNTLSGRFWGYGNNRLTVSPTYYTCKLSLGDNIESVQSDCGRYTSVRAYVPANKDFSLVARNRRAAHLTPTSLSGSSLASIQRTGEFLFKARATAKDATVNASYKDVTYAGNNKTITAAFGTLDKSIQLNWTATNTANSVSGKWHIWRKTASGSWVYLTATGEKNTSSFTDNTIQYNQSYSYIAGFFQDTYQTPSLSITDQITNEVSNISATPVLDINLTATGVDDAVKLVFSTLNHEQLNADVKYAIMRSGQSDIVGSLSYTAGSATASYSYTDSRDMSDICTPKSYQVKLYDFPSDHHLYGYTFTSEEKSALPLSEYALSGDYKASKGEYSSAVNLSWKIIKPAGAAVQSVIKRKLAESNDDYDVIYRLNSTDTELQYTDDKTLPGICYEYLTEIYYTCGESPTMADSKSDIGFCQSKGTVAGNITYGSGTAVGNVDVYVHRNDLAENEAQYRSLRLNGNESNNKWYMGMEKQKALFQTKDWSFQMYVRPDANNDVKGIFDVFYTFEVRIVKQQDGNFKLRFNVIGGSEGSSTFSIPPDRFSQINFVRRDSLITLMYVNDTKKDSVFVESFTMVTGRDSLCDALETRTLFDDVTDPALAVKAAGAGYYVRFGYGFSGYIDEVRFWTKTLSEAEVLSNYNRILTGSETGLAAYWQFDEGLTSRFFDCSRSNGKNNERHGYLESLSASPDPTVPEAYQLGLKAKTDENGNYLIRGIPYSGEGSSYAIVPMMGVHEFQPAEQLRYIGGTSLVHNGTDFTDISSFRVRGKVTYAGGNYPVEGAQLNIDGVASSKDGALIVTDAAGNYDMDVPIGDHFITVTKLGHSFANEGRFPQTDKYNFQDSIYGLNFSDQTTVRIAGRVAGGIKEKDKEIGFGLSKANIGQATLILSPQSNLYKLNTTNNDIIQTDSIGGVSSQTTIKKGVFTDQIEVKTNPETGEFLTLLPPLSYKIVGLSTKELENDDFNYASLEQFETDVNISETISYEDSLQSGEFECHKLLNINYRSEPQFSVSDVGNSSGAFGDSLFLYTDLEQSPPLRDTIALYTVEADNVQYTLGYPVFTKLKSYTWKVKAFEEYTNNDGAEPLVDIVPLQNLNISVDNALASMKVEIDTSSQSSTLTPGSSSFSLDEKGEALYRFTAGFPNLSGNNLLAANMYFENNGKTVSWQSDDFLGIVFGDLPGMGSNFITKGPDIVDFVLRDPSGSNSYSYLEAGSVVSTETTFSDVAGGSSSSSAVLKMGSEQSISTGFGVAVVIETTINRGVTGELNSTWNSLDANTTINTTELSSQLSTSSSSDYVGAEGDVYMGQSTNLIYGLVRNLALYPTTDTSSITGQDNARYALINKEMLSAGIQFETNFNYTQNYIINSLIPNIESNRNSLIRPTAAIPEVNTEALEAPVYYSTLGPDDPQFGQAGSYSVFYPNIPGRVFSDQVKEYNNWISLWEQTIANNERSKVEAIKHREATNKSFDAGSGIEESLTLSSDETESYEFSAELETAKVLEAGIEIGGFGFDLSVRNGRVEAYSESGSSTTTQSKTVGYVLADDSQGDAYSIDVFEPTADGGHIFFTRGGQSSCPYEGPEKSLYYEPGEHILNNGTFQTEKPSLFIDDAKHSLAENIPSGREASFTLKLSNESETRSAVTYQLYVLDGSNPDGLILSIDGTPLNSPRHFLIDYGVTQEKSLKVRQSSTDVLNYSGVTLVLASVCQGDCSADRPWIHSDASFDLRFIPSCTDLKLTSSGTLSNTNTSGAITFKIAEYDRSFKNFAAIRLQYKNSNAHEWTTIREFINDSSLIPLENNNQALISDAAISYSYDMKNLTDGIYQFRAVSVGIIGNDEVLVSSQEIRVVKDMKAPRLLGSASPVNGILTPDGEVSVLFNENIMDDNITDDYISVKAILNGSDIRHSTGLKFSAGDAPYTESAIPLSNRSFSLETWYKRNPGEAGTLFSHGDQFSLGFTADNKLIVQIQGESFSSTDSLPSANWQYLSFSYNNDNQTFSVYDLYESSSVSLFNQKRISAPYAGTGRLTIGSQFTGAAHELTLWGKHRMMADLNDKDREKTANETGLMGYWRMDEGQGNIAQDKVRNRHLTLPNANSWYLNNVNKAVSFDGSDQFLKINTGNIPIDKDESFALEFWFRGSDQTNATLFSCGHGLNDSLPDQKLSIAFNADGLLEMSTNGGIYTLSSKNYLDNSWHHFALNVIRTGSVIAYVDGIAVKQLAAGSISCLMADKMVLGARYYKPAGAQDADDFITDNYFRGAMDEVRLWKSFMTAEALRLNRSHRLYGNETGLIAYYPFEKTIENEYGLNETVSSLEDQLNQPSSSGLLAAGAAVGTAIFTDEAPALKEARTPENVSHTYTASDNKVVINITEAGSRIENCILEFSIRDISDLNGNYLTQAINWTAYVDRNRLTWTDESVTLVQEIMTESVYETSISNQSGKEENWTITNIPSWLSLSKTQGTLKPLSSEKISLRVDESTPIGAYEDILYLTGYNQIDEPLAVSVKVTGKRPDWSVDPGDFEYSLNLIGQASIEQLVSEDTEDLVAAFVGGTCIGIASPIYIKGAYYLMMDIYGNASTDNQDVQFKIWDAGTGRVYPTVSKSEEIKFRDGLLVGSFDVPVQLNAEDIIEQEIALNKGWNWLSLNVLADDMTPNDVFAKVLSHTVLVKDKLNFAANSDGSLLGLLSEIAIGKMYKTSMSQASVLQFTGGMAAVAHYPISLNKGWNWIGYVPQSTMSLSDALADLEPSTGDIIKGHHSFSIYNNDRWQGTLSHLAPGSGYLYLSNNETTQTYCYPSSRGIASSTGVGSSTGIASSAGAMMRSSGSYDSYFTPVVSIYPGNMTMIAKVMDNNTVLTNVEVGVFAGNECRAAATAQDSLFYLTIAGDANQVPLVFRIYHRESGALTEIDQELVYADDAIYGLDTPYIIQLSPSDMEELPAGQVAIFPTSFVNTLNVNSGDKALRSICIKDLRGRILMREPAPGAFNILNLSNLTAGVYMVVVETQEGTHLIRKIIKY